MNLIKSGTRTACASQVREIHFQISGIQGQLFSRNVMGPQLNSSACQGLEFSLEFSRLDINPLLWHHR